MHQKLLTHSQEQNVNYKSTTNVKIFYYCSKYTTYYYFHKPIPLQLAHKQFKIYVLQTIGANWFYVK